MFCVYFDEIKLVHNRSVTLGETMYNYLHQHNDVVVGKHRSYIGGSYKLHIWKNKWQFSIGQE